MSNGKGDTPRNCQSRRFRDNYDRIDWGRKPAIDIEAIKDGLHRIDLARKQQGRGGPDELLFFTREPARPTGRRYGSVAELLEAERMVAVRQLMKKKSK